MKEPPWPRTPLPPPFPDTLASTSTGIHTKLDSPTSLPAFLHICCRIVVEEPLIDQGRFAALTITPCIIGLDTAPDLHLPVSHDFRATYTIVLHKVHKASRIALCIKQPFDAFPQILGSSESAIGRSGHNIRTTLLVQASLWKPQANLPHFNIHHGNVSSIFVASCPCNNGGGGLVL